MAKNSKQRSWKEILGEFIALLLKSINKRPRTWHMHVVPYNGDWTVRREGNKRVTSKHRRQDTLLTGNLEIVYSESTLTPEAQRVRSKTLRH